MIGIQLDGDSEFLETMPDTSIDLTLENPLLGDGDNFLSPGSFSLPFTIPAGEKSPKNAAKLKNPDVIENNAGYQIQKAQLFYDRIPFKKGDLKGKSTNKDRISAHFSFGLNSLSPGLKSARLRDLFDEQVVISNDPFNKEIYIKRVNANLTGFTLNGILFTDDSTSGLGVLIQNYFNAHMVLDGDIWLPWSDLITSGATPGGMTANYLQIRMARQITDIVTGLPILQYSTDPLIELNVKIEEDVRADFELEVCDLTAYYADFKSFNDARLKFPVMFNADLHDDDVQKQTEIINAVDAAGLVVNDPNYAFYKIRNINSLQPFILLKHVIDTIAEELGFEYEGDFYAEPDLATMLIDNSQTLDLPMDLIGDTKFLFWRRSFNLNELLPDLTVVEFFKALKGRYNLGIHVSDTTKKVRITKRETIALSIDNEDITTISTPVEGGEDLRVTGIKLFQPKEDSDDFSVAETLVIGTNAEKTYEMKCGRLFRTKSAIFFGGMVEGPYTSRRDSDKFGFRIFHYKGLVANGTYSYPAAAISGVEINETFTLFGNNLYTKFWQYWILFELNRRLVKVQTRYPFRLLRYYDFERKRRFDRVNYLVKNVRFKISNQKVSISDIQLYTMK
jgi:hypothetical protein